jgi:hypothetical protein
MKRFRFFALTALLVSTQLIAAGCGQIVFTEKYLTYVNEKDTNQFVDLEAAQPSLKAWWHNLPVEPRREGNYVRVNGEAKTEGSYRLEGDAYVLGNPDGQANSRFSIQQDLNLKDDKGETWRRPPVRFVKAKIKKTLVSIVH